MARKARIVQFDASNTHLVSFRRVTVKSKRRARSSILRINAPQSLRPSIQAAPPLPIAKDTAIPVANGDEQEGPVIEDEEIEEEKRGLTRVSRSIRMRGLSQTHGAIE